MSASQQKRNKELAQELERARAEIERLHKALREANHYILRIKTNEAARQAHDRPQSDEWMR